MGDFMQGDRDNAIAVPFSDDEKEPKEATDLLEDDSPSASPEERVSRRQKRQERITRLLNEGKQSAEEVRSLKAELAEVRQQQARLEGAVAAQGQARQQPDDGKDPFERELDAVYERQGQAYNAAQAEIKAGTFTEERGRFYERIAREIETQKTSIHTRRELAQREPIRRQEQAQQVWVQKYPEVYQNPKAFQYAKATFERRSALGEAVTNEVVDEIMHETMTSFRLGPKKAPSASEKARLSGLPSSGSGGGGRSEGVTMTPELKRMAHAAYSDLPEAEAVKRWVNGVGKRLREKKII
jgi:hypothetical protein